MLHQDLKEEAVLAALVDCLCGDSGGTPVSSLVEDNDLNKADVERIVRRVLSKELDSGIAAAVKKELKAQDFEGVVTSVTSKALAKFFEIMFTRKSTWQNQLKGK